MFGLIPRFKAAGYRVISERTEGWRNGHKVSGAILLYKNGWKLELYGHDIFQSTELVASGKKPTKVKFAGMWLNAFRNPELSPCGIATGQRYTIMYNIHRQVYTNRESFPNVPRRVTQHVLISFLPTVVYSSATFPSSKLRCLLTENGYLVIGIEKW